MRDTPIQEFERWEEHVTDPELKDELAVLRQSLDAGDSTAVEDAFFQNLAFGTGGLRGILGVGSNRMNVYTVAQATQGLADYLNEHFDDPSVAIAHDSRHKGVLFSQTVAGVLAANGVRALLYPRLEPTPALSFATRDLGCSAGINVTASHNPSEYNGYKVYGPDGCQITTQAARDIQKAISEVDMFSGVKRIPFEEALSSGMARYIAEDTLDRFIDAVVEQSADEPGKNTGDLKVVYTPLNGTGLECVSRVLTVIGVDEVTVVPEQAEPDGDFPTCPYPNPEIREALQKGLDLCAEINPDILVATDPDADRVGVAVPRDPQARLISGNEMGILLTDWLAKRAADRGENLSEKVVISTIVSSGMLDELAERHGFELRRTLTGFKYIGEQIGMLEAAGQSDRYLFGFEESYGYLAGTHVRDKDAIVASMLICQLARDCKAKGYDLADAVENLYREYGYHKNLTISLSYPGAAGSKQMAQIMNRLRTEPPTSVGGLLVEATVDYAQGAPMPMVGKLPGDVEQVLPAADVFEMRLAGSNKLIVRPSGTEPKIKAYVFARGDTEQDATQLVGVLEAAARELLAP